MIIVKGLTPSGGQYWNRHTMDTSEERFAFCSTLAVYIYNLRNYSIEKIIATHESNIICLIWNPSNPKYIATASNDCNFYIWDILQEKAKVLVTLPSPPIMMQWNPVEEDFVLLLLESGGKTN